MRAFTAAKAFVLAAAASLGLSFAEDVSVDLTPCIFSNGEVKQDEGLVSEAFLLGEFFKGFWGSTLIQVDANTESNPSFSLDDELSDGGSHGYCNVVFVGFLPEAEEYAALGLYSRKFQVRIVYLTVTASDEDELDKLGCAAQFKMPFNNEQNLTESYIEGIRLLDGNSRLVKPNLETHPKKNNIYVTPMVVVRPPPMAGAEVTVVAEYIDENAETMKLTETYTSVDGTTETTIDYRSAAAVTYIGPGGAEEMHVFFRLAWFDLGSWAWAHYITEWATKGIFQGERRFWLGAQVDDLFLDTAVFQWDGDTNEGSSPIKERVSYDDLYALLEGTEQLNKEYNSNITTEFPFNGLGILEKVGSAQMYSFDDADAALLPKGEAPQANPDGTVGFEESLVTPANWWSEDRLAGLADAFTSEEWIEKDDLLKASLELAERFHWQSHTMSHLARDNLGETDCIMEDGANAWLAVITGMYQAKTYNWRSMTNPGITGLFNKNCLRSAMDNLITCAPGDNTYVGSESVPVSLISDVSQFHSIYTTEETNGLDGFQIVPRFATYVYYNCRTMECLVEENLYIRRKVCGCAETNPRKDDGMLNDDREGCDMTLCPTPGVDGKAGPEDFQAFMTAENIFATEAETTVRYLLSGRRDMYMFHQANVVPTTTPLEGEEEMSMLEFWYRVVLEEISQYINIKGDASSSFGVKSVKFDDLCTNFRHHEDLDFSSTVVTVTKSAEGVITNMELSHNGDATVVPVTVPTSEVGNMKTDEWGMKVLDSEKYGSDTTFYTSTTGEPPLSAKQPTSDDLPRPPTSPTDGGEESSDESSDDRWDWKRRNHHYKKGHGNKGYGKKRGRH